MERSFSTSSSIPHSPTTVGKSHIDKHMTLTTHLTMERIKHTPCLGCLPLTLAITPVVALLFSMTCYHLRRMVVSCTLRNCSFAFNLFFFQVIGILSRGFLHQQNFSYPRTRPAAFRPFPARLSASFHTEAVSECLKRHYIPAASSLGPPLNEAASSRPSWVPWMNDFQGLWRRGVVVGQTLPWLNFQTRIMAVVSVWGVSGEITVADGNG